MKKLTELCNSIMGNIEEKDCSKCFFCDTDQQSSLDPMAEYCYFKTHDPCDYDWDHILRGLNPDKLNKSQYERTLNDRKKFQTWNNGKVGQNGTGSMLVQGDKETFDHAYFGMLANGYKEKIELNEK